MLWQNKCNRQGGLLVRLAPTPTLGQNGASAIDKGLKREAFKLHTVLGRKKRLKNISAAKTKLNLWQIQSQEQQR
jgi:hypothetical protein